MYPVSTVESSEAEAGAEAEGVQSRTIQVIEMIEMIEDSA
jgi:hypothetical protein